MHLLTLFMHACGSYPSDLIALFKLLTQNLIRQTLIYRDCKYSPYKQISFSFWD